ncbi:hypothetical protein EDB83DRAFT_2228515, partial [Lactarius deliciosus]
TLRRHAAAMHAPRYRKWCELNNFNSMLPQDTKQRKCAETDLSQQTSVTDHFGPEDPNARVIPYSDSALQTAALEWLIETNQPIQAFGHPAFKKMLDIASRAKRNIILPSPKQSRARILKMFKQQLWSLRRRLAVGFLYHVYFCWLTPCCIYSLGSHGERRNQPDL